MLRTARDKKSLEIARLLRDNKQAEVHNIYIYIPYPQPVARTQAPPLTQPASGFSSSASRSDAVHPHAQERARLVFFLDRARLVFFLTDVYVDRAGSACSLLSVAQAHVSAKHRS